MRTIACVLALMAFTAVRADVPDSALLGVFDTCTLQRTALVDGMAGACAAVPAKLKKCTARLQLTRNATMTTAPVVKVENEKYGSTVSDVRFDAGYSYFSSGVSDPDCNDFFNLAGTQGQGSEFSAGAIQYPDAEITRTVCPTTSYLEGYTSVYIARSKFVVAPPGSSALTSADSFFLSFGDPVGSDVDAVVKLYGYKADGNRDWDAGLCLAQYEVVAGSCMFGGQSGTPPTCSGSGGSGGGSGGASASMALPSVGVGALLVLSLLAVAVVGMTGLAAMR